MAAGRRSNPVSVEFRAMLNRYRHKVRVGPPRNSAEEIDPNADYAELHRNKNSHVGIADRKNLRQFAAVAVNQDFLEEIGELNKLTHLDMRWPIKADDLSPLRSLKNLEVLHMDSPTKVEDWSPLYELKKLKVLTIENPRKMRDLNGSSLLKGSWKSLASREPSTRMLV